jgi:hypothetical protein
MIIEDQLRIADELLATGLIKQVFHSVELIQDTTNNNFLPAFPKGAEYEDITDFDKLGRFAYIRQNGDAIATPQKIGSCGKDYFLNVPLRIVVYNDKEDKDPNVLVDKLGSLSFLPRITLLRVRIDKYALGKEECNMRRANFDGKVFYVAFDISVQSLYLRQTCDVNDCQVYPNPVCK